MSVSVVVVGSVNLDLVARVERLPRPGETVGGAAFSRGVAAHPEDPRMYRHRGHRYITVRELDKAVADLSKASALVAGS